MPLMVSHESISKVYYIHVYLDNDGRGYCAYLDNDGRGLLCIP